MLQLRGLGGGAAATCNWITNAVVSQTFLTLIQHLGGSGTFWLYAVIALAGAVWVYFALPETNGSHRQFCLSYCSGGIIAGCMGRLSCRSCQQCSGHARTGTGTSVCAEHECTVSDMQTLSPADHMLALHVVDFDSVFAWLAGCCSLC